MAINSAKLMRSNYQSFIHHLQTLFLILCSSISYMELQVPSFSVLFFFLLFIFLVLRILKKPKTKKLTPTLPPGPWKLPILGNVHQLFGSLPHHRLHELAKKFGPVMHLQLGEVHSVVISSPDTAKEVMKTHDINFARRPFLLAAEIVFCNSTNIAYAPYGDYWIQMRKSCALALLSATRVPSFTPIREEEVSEFIGSISSRAGSLINLSRMLFCLQCSILSRAAFGSKEQQAALMPIVEEIIDLSRNSSIADLFPSIKFLNRISGMRSRLERLHQEADKILENIVNKHKDSKAVAKIGDKGGTDDLVDALLNVQNNASLEFPLTTGNIKAVLLDIFTVGTEAVSTVAEWAMSAMLKNPRVMEKAQAEVRQVFCRKGNVDEAGLGEINYLKLVIKETLRLHPPVPLLLPRECGEQCEIDGYQIPIKSIVFVNAWAIGRDTNYWAEAERFYPERFLDSTIDYKGTNFELIPFGAGRRICPGMLFGLAGVELALANLLYHFDWKLPNGMSPESLDMYETFGIVAKRKNDLELIPVLCHTLAVA